MTDLPVPDTDVPVDTITALLQALVRQPSRAGEDDLAPICRQLEEWLQAHGLAPRVLRDGEGRPIGLYAEVRGRRPGRWTVLDAPLDTAGLGARATWRHDPLAATIEDGWLHGRGSGDAKAAVALFAHLLAQRRAHGDDFDGCIGLLLDGDEHSGRFGGARAFFDRPGHDGRPPRPDGVLIGYPGIDRLMTGSRGFLRARLRLHGVAAHAGAASRRGVDAISRAVALAAALQALPLPAAGPGFALPPALTITGIEGGAPGFAQVADRCELRLDLRLTPEFDDASARAAVERLVAAQDAAWPAAASTAIDWLPGWPAYRVADADPLPQAMAGAAAQVLGQPLPTALAGPSNIGNYLTSIGVPALCGFGVRAHGLHAADERIELASLAPVFRVYREALRRLHAG